MKHATGFDACSFCLQHGASIKYVLKGSTVPYIKTSNIKLRTHEDTIAIAKRVESSENPMNGIKGILRSPHVLGFMILNPDLAP